MTIRGKILSRINEKLSLNESVQLTKLDKDIQFAYKNLRKHLDKIGSKYKIKYNDYYNSLEVVWGDYYKKDANLLKKEDAFFRKYSYDNEFKAKNFKNVLINFSDSVSGYGIHDIY